MGGLGLCGALFHNLGEVLAGMLGVR